MSILPAICRYWREVALNTTTLWSVVTLHDSSPFNFSTRCLKRSGTTALLDVEIHLSNRFWGHSDNPTSESYTLGTLDALNTIVENGGATSRSRSFRLYTPKQTHLEPLLAALEFIRKHSTPALESFELNYDGTFFTKSWYASEEHYDEPFIFDPPPNLKALTVKIPESLRFSDSKLPWPANLVRLEITFRGKLPHVRDINALLTATPLVTVLTIKIIRANGSYADIATYINMETVSNLPKVSLLNLRAFALICGSPSNCWEYVLLLTLDAPNVQSLRLSVEDPLSIARLIPQDLVSYVARGSDCANPRPLFPRLTGLEMTVRQRQHGYNLEKELLATYPAITTLFLPNDTAVPILSAQPWLVPNLERLVIPLMPLLGLREAVEARWIAGIGPDVVEQAALGNGDIEYNGPEYRKLADRMGTQGLGRSDDYVREVLGFEDP